MSRLRVALYARYSSDNQRDASIADQLRMCRLRAEKEGWTIVEEYTDHAISGSSMILRSGIQALITDSSRGRFDMILAEAMDRRSRDQEDIAGIFKRMTYADVKMFTLSAGEITHLHVGLKGTMNALFLKDLADKTRRGLRGRVEDGKSGGGLPHAARAVMDALPRLEDNPYVIAGKIAGQHASDLQCPWRRIRAKAGLDNVRIHDLRHTYASNAVSSGMPIQMVGRLLGHTQLQTTMRYAHLADDPVRRAAEENAARLNAALGIPSENVARLRVVS